MAKEMYIGCDLVHEKHMNLIKEVFDQCKEIQSKRELILKEMAQLAQLYRDLQLKNTLLMENVDEQLDKILSIKEHIEFLKKELLTVRKRQVAYLAELFELYKSKDRDIEYLNMTVEIQSKERDLIEKRRDEAFSQLVDLLSERRRVLGVIQDNAHLMSMRYMASKAEE